MALLQLPPNSELTNSTTNYRTSKLHFSVATSLSQNNTLSGEVLLIPKRPHPKLPPLHHNRHFFPYSASLSLCLSRRQSFEVISSSFPGESRQRRGKRGEIYFAGMEKRGGRGKRALSNERRSCGRVTSAANLTPSFLSSPTIGLAVRVACLKRF